MDWPSQSAQDKPSIDKYIVSIRAREQEVIASDSNSLADEALHGADSGIRSKLTWELQIDKNEPALDRDACSQQEFEEWIRAKTGAVCWEFKAVDDLAPTQYCIEIMYDGDTAESNNANAWYAWAKNSPILRARVDSFEGIDAPLIEKLSKEDVANGRFGMLEEGTAKLPSDLPNDLTKEKKKYDYYRCWDGCAAVSTKCEKLDRQFTIQFAGQRKYRKGDLWLIPVRGVTITSKDWQYPSGQHYFEILSIVESPGADGSDAPDSGDGSPPSPAAPSPGGNDQSADAAIDQLLGTHDSQYRSVPVASLAGETTSVGLQRWLGTALLSEILIPDFEQFWKKVSTCLAEATAKPDEERDEAYRVWQLAQEIDRSLRESATPLTRLISAPVNKLQPGVHA